MTNRKMTREEMIKYLVNDATARSSKRSLEITFQGNNKDFCGKRFVIKKSTCKNDIDISLYDENNNLYGSFDRKKNTTKIVDIDEAIMVKYAFSHDDENHLLVIFVIEKPVKCFFFHLSASSPHHENDKTEVESKSVSSIYTISHNQGPGGGRD